jgi:hypothetical protein
VKHDVTSLRSTIQTDKEVNPDLEITGLVFREILGLSGSDYAAMRKAGAFA